MNEDSYQFVLMPLVQSESSCRFAITLAVVHLHLVGGCVHNRSGEEVMRILRPILLVSIQGAGAFVRQLETQRTG